MTTPLSRAPSGAPVPELPFTVAGDRASITVRPSPSMAGGPVVIEVALHDAPDEPLLVAPMRTCSTVEQNALLRRIVTPLEVPALKAELVPLFAEVRRRCRAWMP